MQLGSRNRHTFYLQYRTINTQLKSLLWTIVTHVNNIQFHTHEFKTINKSLDLVYD